MTTATESSTAIERAAAWLAAIPVEKQPHPILPHIRRQFDLNLRDGITAVTMAGWQRRQAKQEARDG